MLTLKRKGSKEQFNTFDDTLYTLLKELFSANAESIFHMMDKQKDSLEQKQLLEILNVLFKIFNACCLLEYLLSQKRMCVGLLDVGYVV